ncbi:hypothetical protein JH314_11915 [Xanthomonas campestris]|uniref:hypothetical protein n=1 Tax=Xanthomonas TaxID=338 RepID=UPI0005C57993|nr:MULTISPECIES: hypothetical protein [Xanthomonas]MCC5094579.1 hypothetical protein [Xanthomonas campestris pv. incanae]MEA9482778.1 hypothetical protein [Xanthomonas campestris]MEA9491444.1 hypothetical protein [Xanthomonas campestris]MEA9510037.1 hypothetical protein [Xanthomonas campestris]MEA9576148.1 hypothetical protein [Xanthomonas campestris]
MNQQQQPDLQPTAGRMPTPTEAALVEYGKQLLLKSTETALDFHKTMLGISATFGTLVAALIPVLVWGDKEAKVPMAEGWLLILPLLLMLLSSVVFAWGYYPRHATININVIEDIKAAREKVITSRKVLAGVGLGLFSASLLLALGLALYFRANV